MGPWLPALMVALEDRRFYSHPGVDLRSVARAVLRRHGGGSTITQQFVKMVTSRRGRSFPVKLREMGMALQLERRWSKDQILEAYLNRIPFGNRLIGVEAAAQAYFNKPALALTKVEAAYLAGLPREPTRLNPWSHHDAAARRFAQTCGILDARGILQRSEWAGDPAPLPGRYLPQNAAPHFIQWAAEPGRLGNRVCTLDLDVQRRAEQLVREHLDLIHRVDISQASMVVIENETGAVRALVGSRDFKANQINGAVSFRNCGSTLKPFLYVTGIEQRVFTAATLLPDTADAARDSYADYDPHNFVLSHLGPVRVREALGSSLNVPAVVALSRVGARKAFNSMGDWGLRFNRPMEKAGAGFILGNVGVRLLDLTAAFAGLARGGLVAPPQWLENRAGPFRRIVSEGAALIVVDILCDNSARFHGFGPHSVLSFPVRVGVKTGTSAGFHDAWTVGFTREHTVGVWVGNFEGRPMDHTASIAAAGPLWRRMIEDLLQTDHPVPDSKLDRMPVCALTGLRPCASSPAVVGELFLPGTEPQRSAERWFTKDGHQVLPVEYAAWCASVDNRLGAVIDSGKESLAIVSPRNGAVFKLDASIPASHQEIEMQVNLPEGVTWTLNGNPIAPSATGHLLWPLKEGEWVLEASNGAARVTAQFAVRRN